MAESTAAKKTAAPQAAPERKAAERKPANDTSERAVTKKAAEAKTQDVSLNDLEKDLAKGNEAVQEYLTRQLVKEGYFNPEDDTIDKKLQEQNDPSKAPEKTSDKLTALEVAKGAVEDKKKNKGSAASDDK